jgi:hypothetical protein
MTFIPPYIITNLKADTPEDYQFKSTGFSTTIGSLMARNLNVSIRTIIVEVKKYCLTPKLTQWSNNRVLKIFKKSQFK